MYKPSTLRSPNAPAGDEITLTATASSGLPVTYVLTAELLPDGTPVASLNGAVLTLLGAGTATITASQTGDDTYAAAADVEQTITVRQPKIRWVTESGAGIADGSSWANAMPLRPALASSFTPGDQLRIAGGEYTPHAGNDQTARFTIPEGLRVYGGFAGTETAFPPRHQRHPPPQ